MDRILTTHSGSIVRPQWLRDGNAAIARGEPADEGFAARLSGAVADVVKAQAEVGVDVVNDGEFTKLSYLTSIYNRVRGIESRAVPYDPAELRSLLPPNMWEEVARQTLSDIDPEIAGSIDLSNELYRFISFMTSSGPTGSAGHEGLGWYCTGPISYDPTELDEHMAILSTALARVDVAGAFVGSISPASIHYMTNEYYKTDEEFIYAISAALGDEYRRIVDAGFDLHIDDPVMWHKHSTIRLAGGTPEDYANWANLRIDALNTALEGIPQERIRFHICSSSAHSAKVFDPMLAEILPFVLRVKWGQLLFEQGNVRHEHEWRIWEEAALPEDRVLAPGVVTHQTQMVEHPELVAERLVRLANIVGRERIMAGTDCGFDWARGPRSAPWTQWAKLRSLAEGAERASEQLWAKRTTSS